MTTAPDLNAVGQCTVHAPPVANKGETRTRAVVALTAVMMVIELLVGWWTHSLALLADGWHMGTHVGALGISALAYWYARTRAGQTEFAFGTGKVYALAGYTSAGLLIAVAVGVIIESVSRMLNPEIVRFAEAFPVAVLGLVVNLLSAWLLDVPHDHAHSHSHEHGDHDHHHDHNLRAAYLHVVADALTSVLAIVALLAGRYLHWTWVDPLVAVFGALVILKWGAGLIRECGRQLIDLDPSKKHREKVIAALEGVVGTRVVDLHLWRVGPRQLVCMVSVASASPRPLEEYKQLVLGAVPVDHLTVEICTT
ncbi:MAG: CDF family Co(II)/Ni(II) efflux transporter DmeF [Archangium sp.]|nr:CDF family Co(II)/Ni(II) efflux transporter DmeF [Archangium sp.]MDP3570757.1 CDF family Co(II)/Ni(II) efflux transporter DmeF [Archangium sp.]